MERYIPRIATVIPIHNGVRHTLRCLASLQRATVRPDCTIVVDDGSTDGSAEAIKGVHPHVVLLRGDGNLWWSGAMNLGVEYALSIAADFVFALNNDCVVDGHSLVALVECYRECAPAVVCSKVRPLPDDGCIVSVGGVMNWWWRGAYLRGGGEQDTGQWDARAEVDWVPGMGVLIPRACFEVIGLYDQQRFPHYRGDIDFALRARKAGFRLLCEPQSVIWNDRGQTGLQIPERPTVTDAMEILTSRRSQFNLREAARFMARHSPPLALPFGLGSYYGMLFASLARRWVSPKTTNG